MLHFRFCHIQILSPIFISKQLLIYSNPIKQLLRFKFVPNLEKKTIFNILQQYQYLISKDQINFQKLTYSYSSSILNPNPSGRGALRPIFVFTYFKIRSLRMGLAPFSSKLRNTKSSINSWTRNFCIFLYGVISEQKKNTQM